jgi:hypothetical protein
VVSIAAFQSRVKCVYIDYMVVGSAFQTPLFFAMCCGIGLAFPSCRHQALFFIQSHTKGGSSTSGGCPVVKDEFLRVNGSKRI